MRIWYLLFLITYVSSQKKLIIDLDDFQLGDDLIQYSRFEIPENTWSISITGSSDNIYDFPSQQSFLLALSHNSIPLLDTSDTFTYTYSNLPFNLPDNLHPTLEHSPPSSGHWFVGLKSWSVLGSYKKKPFPLQVQNRIPLRLRIELLVCEPAWTGPDCNLPCKTLLDGQDGSGQLRKGDNRPYYFAIPITAGLTQLQVQWSGPVDHSSKKNSLKMVLQPSTIPSPLYQDISNDIRPMKRWTDDGERISLLYPQPDTTYYLAVYHVGSWPDNQSSISFSISVIATLCPDGTLGLGCKLPITTLSITSSGSYFSPELIEIPPQSTQPVLQRFYVPPHLAGSEFRLRAKLEVGRGSVRLSSSSPYILDNDPLPTGFDLAFNPGAPDTIQELALFPVSTGWNFLIYDSGAGSEFRTAVEIRSGYCPSSCHGNRGECITTSGSLWSDSNIAQASCQCWSIYGGLDCGSWVQHRGIWIIQFLFLSLSLLPFLNIVATLNHLDPVRFVLESTIMSLWILSCTLRLACDELGVCIPIGTAHTMQQQQIQIHHLWSVSLRLVCISLGCYYSDLPAEPKSLIYLFTLLLLTSQSSPESIYSIWLTLFIITLAVATAAIRSYVSRLHLPISPRFKTKLLSSTLITCILGLLTNNSPYYWILRSSWNLSFYFTLYYLIIAKEHRLDTNYNCVRRSWPFNWISLLPYSTWSGPPHPQSLSSNHDGWYRYLNQNDGDDYNDYNDDNDNGNGNDNDNGDQEVINLINDTELQHIPPNPVNFESQKSK